jgi:hypothetical protein
MGTLQYDKLLNDIPDGALLNEEDLIRRMKTICPGYRDESIHWVLTALEKNGLITHVGKKRWRKGPPKPLFSYSFSSSENDVIHEIELAYPNLPFLVYSTSLMNRWLSQQILRSIIVVETSRPFVEHLLSTLWAAHPGLVFPSLPSPELSPKTAKPFIIVSPWVSKAPLDKDTHKIRLEKLLIDTYYEKALKRLFIRDNAFEVRRQMIRGYRLNEDQVLTYGVRRHLSQEKQVELRELFKEANNEITK